MRALSGFMIEDEDGNKIFDCAPINTLQDLNDAVDDGKLIYSIDEETNLPDKLMFDGNEWIEHGKIEVVDNDVSTVPVVSYVDQRIEALQTEIEALTVAVASVAPDSPAIAVLQANNPTIVAAIEFDDEAELDTAINNIKVATKNSVSPIRK